MPFSSSSVAGAGTGITPWAHFTVPPPTFSGDATKLLDCQCLSAHRCAHDIGDRVSRSDFVEVDVLHVNVVDLCLGSSQCDEDLARRLLGAVADGGRFDNLQNLVQISAMGVRIGVLHVRARGRVHDRFHGCGRVRTHGLRVWAQNSSRGRSFWPFTITSTLVAEIPLRSTREASKVIPKSSAATVFWNNSNGTPASTNAPRNMSPLMPENPSRYAIRMEVARWHAAPALCQMPGGNSHHR